MDVHFWGGLHGPLGIHGCGLGPHAPKDVCQKKNGCRWCTHGLQGKPCDDCDMCLKTWSCCTRCLQNADCCYAVSGCCMSKSRNICEERESFVGTTTNCATEPGSNIGGAQEEPITSTAAHSAKRNTITSTAKRKTSTAKRKTVAAFPSLCVLVIALLATVESESQ